jgi:hypothetical protein|tara:strand:- start:107 stop:424 length:318 start_codon:yes stop_codon:yes gene_type:complete
MAKMKFLYFDNDSDNAIAINASQIVGIYIQASQVVEIYGNGGLGGDDVGFHVRLDTVDGKESDVIKYLIDLIATHRDATITVADDRNSKYVHTNITGVNAISTGV